MRYNSGNRKSFGEKGIKLEKRTVILLERTKENYEKGVYERNFAYHNKDYLIRNGRSMDDLIYISKYLMGKGSDIGLRDRETSSSDSRCKRCGRIIGKSDNGLCFSCSDYNLGYRKAG